MIRLVTNLLVIMITLNFISIQAAFSILGCGRNAETKIIRPQFPVHPYSFGTHLKKTHLNGTTPQVKSQNEIKLNFSGTLAGTWQEVVGNVCFWHTYPESHETQLINVIGLPTISDGNGGYKTTNWDKKVFWFDPGDGVPMHLSAAFTVTTDENGNPVTDSRAFFANNVFYRLKGKDYSKYEFGGQYANFWIFTDNNNIPDSWSVDLYDDNGEYTETIEPKAGDQIQTWTAAIAPEEPGAFYMTTMEDSFRTLTSSMKVFYDHLTPNVDFPNTITKTLIDFPEVELIYILSAKNIDDQGIPTYGLSKPVNSNNKWDNTIDSSTSIHSWNLFDFFKK